MAREYRRQWSGRLGTSKPRARVKGPKWTPPSTDAIASFLFDYASEGPQSIIIEGISSSSCAYVIGTTLHVDVLKVHHIDELNLITLCTQFGLVDEVRLHTFHLNHYLTSRRCHLRIQRANWRVVRFVLSYIVKEPAVQRVPDKKSIINITFDDFLKPVIEAWKKDLPLKSLVYGLPEYETDLISTYSNLDWVHVNVGALEEGYSSESDWEVDEINDQLEEYSDFAGDGAIIIMRGAPLYYGPHQ